MDALQEEERKFQSARGLSKYVYRYVGMAGGKELILPSALLAQSAGSAGVVGRGCSTLHNGVVTMRLGLGAGLGRRRWPQNFCTTLRSAMLVDAVDKLEIVLVFSIDPAVDDGRTGC